MAHHLWLISYDIACDRARARIERQLLGWGERVNYSVFECYMNPDQLARLRGTLQQHLDPDADSLRIYPICGDCECHIAWQGQGRSPNDPDLIVI
ncbi:MAG: CRISPR-associated endonuclease Cas2 [Halothiobacillaceae bacterium]|nr:CRISPR-associated endonuclease Cas2 [Halothiobacillaceae bacterium]